MTIDRQKLLGHAVGPKRLEYSLRDSRLYALSIGMGTDPLSEPELDFVTERKTFKTMPTMASIFADVIVDLTKACAFAHPELVLHGQQKLELFKPLPGAAILEISGSIAAIYDRGAERGAEVHMQAEARIWGDDKPLYRTTFVTIARGDGGFGGPAPERTGVIHRLPDRPADGRYEFQTTRNQALVYSLNGDLNPIHTQPRFAAKAGFNAPILHGLCTYGIACRAVVAACCDYDSARIRRFDVRFSAPVVPGETLDFEFWQIESGVAFQGRAREKDVLVLKDGICEFV